MPSVCHRWNNPVFAGFHSLIVGPVRAYSRLALLRLGQMTLLTMPEAAQYLAVSLDTVRRLVEAGALPTVRLRRTVRIDPADLAALINNNKARPAQEKSPCHSTNAALSGGSASRHQTGASYAKLLKLPTVGQPRGTTTRESGGQPYQKYYDQGYFRLVPVLINKGEYSIPYQQVMVTGKGLAFLKALMDSQVMPGKELVKGEAA